MTSKNALLEISEVNLEVNFSPCLEQPALSDSVRQFVESKQPKLNEEAAEFPNLSYQISRIGKESMLGQSNAFGSKSGLNKFTDAAGAKQFGNPKQVIQKCVLLPISCRHAGNM